MEAQQGRIKLEDEVRRSLLDIEQAANIAK
jgi:hypothetical protein